MDVSAIERAAATAWPAKETAALGEWALSFGDGFSRRRNSAVPIGAVPDDVEQHIAEVESFYRARGLTTRFRITPECDPAIDVMLGRLGYASEAPTFVMTRALNASGIDDGVVESPSVTDAWIDAELDALGVDRSLVGPWLETIRAVPQPATFATAIKEGATVGAGFGVVVEGLLVSFEVAVAEGHRRQGHARRLMSALHTFGVREGANAAFLQVMEDNHGAIAMYERLGYETVYSYWYRMLEA